MVGKNLEFHEIIKSPEFVASWDVFRYEQGGFPVTVNCDYGYYDGPELTLSQITAVRRAVKIWADVCRAEDSDQAEKARRNDGSYDWKHPNMVKSRLLGRMIHDGLPPTKTRPPRELAGPAWWQLPGGDPYIKYERYYPDSPTKHYYLSGDTNVGVYPDTRNVPSLFEVKICGRCGAVIGDSGLHDGVCP